MAGSERPRWRLTLLYSAVFLACFWIFSVGLYLLVEGSFEVEVGEKLVQQRPSLAKGPDLAETMIDVNEAALDRLYLVLVVFNIHTPARFYCTLPNQPVNTHQIGENCR